jgi:hypothetical protein
MGSKSLSDEGDLFNERNKTDYGKEANLIVGRLTSIVSKTLMKNGIETKSDEDICEKHYCKIFMN